MAVDVDRSRTLRRLLRHGMPLDCATDAVDGDRVLLALLEHLLDGPPLVSRDELAAATGLSDSLIDLTSRVVGLSPGAGYSERSVRHMDMVARLAELLPEDALVEQFRADLPALRGMVMRSLATIEHLLIRPVMAAIEDPIDAAVVIADHGRPILEAVTPLMGETYRRILMLSITSDLVVESLRTPEETIQAAIAFVDVVGYTSIAGRVDPQGLGDMLNRFEAACTHVVEEQPAIRLVKFLGDAAMFVCVDPVILSKAIVHMVDEHAEEVDPEQTIPVSGGVAFGETLVRRGDYFGTPVNEAARLTDLARRHTVLASGGMGDVLDGHFRLKRLRPVTLHGLGRQRPYALRPVDSMAHPD